MALLKYILVAEYDDDDDVVLLFWISSFSIIFFLLSITRLSFLDLYDPKGKKLIDFF